MQRFSATLLILLFIFDVGACPCGCLDHNGWLELFSTDEVKPFSGTVSTSTSSNDDWTPVLADQHCDGTGKAKYRMSARRRDLTHDASMSAALCKAPLCCETASTTDRATLGRRPSGKHLALPVRAALQVWRT